MGRCKVPSASGLRMAVIVLIRGKLSLKGGDSSPKPPANTRDRNGGEEILRLRARPQARHIPPNCHAERRGAKDLRDGGVRDRGGGVRDKWRPDFGRAKR